MNYEEMGTIELRKLVREMGLAKGAAVASANKPQLLALLNGEIEALDVPSLTAGGDLADILAEALKGRITAGIDADEVGAIVDERLAKHQGLTPAEIESLIDTALTKVIAPTIVRVEHYERGAWTMQGTQHKQFPKLVQMAQSRDKDGHHPPIYMHGPAGTGKTTAARKVSEALGLDYYFNGAIDSEYKLSGFIDAQGVFRSRPFYDAFTKGGVYLFDELDSSMPSAVLAFNAALANGHADFPDGHHERHPDSIILAAGNTTLRGDGGNEGFMRFEMDGAFSDRFVFLHWPLDTALEAACVPTEYQDWLTTVKHVRANVELHGIKKAAVTPRATFAGMALLQGGLDRESVIDSTLRKGMPESQWKLASEGL